MPVKSKFFKATSALLTVAATLGSSVTYADEPVGMEFPWGCDVPNLTRKAEYRTIQPQNSAAARPIARMPEKVPYAYGWFGPNPDWHWNRQFGHSKSFTQWSQR